MIIMNTKELVESLSIDEKIRLLNGVEENLLESLISTSGGHIFWKTVKNAG